MSACSIGASPVATLRIIHSFTHSFIHGVTGPPVVLSPESSTIPRATPTGFPSRPHLN